MRSSWLCWHQSSLDWLGCWCIWLWAWGAGGMRKYISSLINELAINSSISVWAWICLPWAGHGWRPSVGTWVPCVATWVLLSAEWMGKVGSSKKTLTWIHQYFLFLYMYISVETCIYRVLFIEWVHLRTGSGIWNSDSKIWGDGCLSDSWPDPGYDFYCLFDLPLVFGLPIWFVIDFYYRWDASN